MGSDEEVTTTMRIFVGGLGNSVREGELEKTFSSLGIVKNIQIIRSHGRSFAYMDYQPSSPKSLSKLFSVYNGCIWKGGRLRLEKAKEHYLVRLKREWAEDEEVAKRTNDGVVKNKNIETLESSKLLIPEKTQLRMFFPKLRKVKSLPYTGTGKHKYSFQRIEVPSLPINFCDCEEHRVPSESAKEKQVAVIEDKSGSVNEAEVNLMTSVMNNIFERSLNLRNPYEKTRIDANGEMSDQSLDGSSFDESGSDQKADVDNLVMNMVSGSSKLGLLKEQGEDMIAKDQISISRKRQFSRDGLTQNKVKARKGNNLILSNFLDPISRKQLPSDRSNIEEIMPSEPNGKGNRKSLPKESNGLRRAESLEQKKASIHQFGDFSVRRKSSWRKLVGEMDNSSFNISNILQSAPSKDLPKSNGLDTARSVDSVSRNLVKQLANEPIGECSEPMGIGEDETLQSMVTGGSILAPIGTPCKDSVGPRDVNSSEQEDINLKKTEGHSWMQKSSWRELVGGGVDNSSFSISNILPDIQYLPESKSSDVLNSMNGKVELMKSEHLTTGDSSNGACVRKGGNLHSELSAPVGSNLETSAMAGQISAGMGSLQLHNKTERDSGNEKDNFGYGKPSGNENNKSSDKKLLVEPEIGVLCTFMRCAASEKEWMKTRAALSGALKKKSNK